MDIKVTSRRGDPWDYALQRTLELEIDRLAEGLVSMSASSFEEYKYICGQICGIRFAMNQLFEVRGRLAQDGDSE